MATRQASRPSTRWRTWRRRWLDQDFVDELAGHFRAGATVKIAAGRVGVPPGVLRMWLNEGERQLKEIYSSDVGYPEQEGLLYHDCAKATAEYLADRVDIVTKPGDAEWRNSSWLLERRDEDFNPAVKVESLETHRLEVEIEHSADELLEGLRSLGLVAPALDSEALALPPAHPDVEAGPGAPGAEVSGPIRTG